MPILKAFLLCQNITDHPTDRAQKDLLGAGLSRIECVDPLPVKVSFWVFAQLADQKASGEVRLALMRADSGRRYFFRGVYFIELWYDNVWVVDQRLELV